MFGKGYIFSWFSLSASGQTLDILPAQHDCQLFLPSMRCSAFDVVSFLSLWVKLRFFGIFEHVLCRTLVIRVEKD